MKKTYETPVAEKIEFCYEEQVVASGAQGCTNAWVNEGAESCTSGNSFLQKVLL